MIVILEKGINWRGRNRRSGSWRGGVKKRCGVVTKGKGGEGTEEEFVKGEWRRSGKKGVEGDIDEPRRGYTP
jgi:hypothetical protein